MGVLVARAAVCWRSRLRVEEVSSPWFAHFDGYDCGRAPEIVDHLLNLISTRGME